MDFELIQYIGLLNVILHIHFGGLEVSFLTSCVCFLTEQCEMLIQAVPPPIPYNQSAHPAPSKTAPHWTLGDIQMKDFIRLGCLSLRQSAMLVLNLGVGLPLQFLNGFFSGLQEAVGVVWNIFLVSRLTYNHVGGEKYI